MGRCPLICIERGLIVSAAVGCQRDASADSRVLTKPVFMHQQPVLSTICDNEGVGPRAMALAFCS